MRQRKNTYFFFFLLPTPHTPPARRGGGGARTVRAPLGAAVARAGAWDALGSFTARQPAARVTGRPAPRSTPRRRRPRRTPTCRPRRPPRFQIGFLQRGKRRKLRPQERGRERRRGAGVQGREPAAGGQRVAPRHAARVRLQRRPCLARPQRVRDRKRAKRGILGRVQQHGEERRGAGVQDVAVKEVVGGQGDRWRGSNASFLPPRKRQPHKQRPHVALHVRARKAAAGARRRELAAGRRPRRARDKARGQGVDGKRPPACPCGRRPSPWRARTGVDGGRGGGRRGAARRVPEEERKGSPAPSAPRQGSVTQSQQSHRAHSPATPPFLPKDSRSCAACGRPGRPARRPRRRGAQECGARPSSARPAAGRHAQCGRQRRAPHSAVALSGRPPFLLAGAIRRPTHLRAPESATSTRMVGARAPRMAAVGVAAVATWGPSAHPSGQHASTRHCREAGEGRQAAGANHHPQPHPRPRHARPQRGER